MPRKRTIFRHFKLSNLKEKWAMNELYVPEKEKSAPIPWNWITLRPPFTSFEGKAWDRNCLFQAKKFTVLSNYGNIMNSTIMYEVLVATKLTYIIGSSFTDCLSHRPLAVVLLSFRLLLDKWSSWLIINTWIRDLYTKSRRFTLGSVDYIIYIYICICTILAGHPQN